MTDDMKPVRCGCGGEARIEAHYDINGADIWQLRCPCCGIKIGDRRTESEAITAWNKAMSSAEPERKWHINFDPYDESTSPKEKGYYRIIEEDGTEKTDYFFGEPRMTGHGIGYWATSEKTIIAWARLEWE